MKTEWNGNQSGQWPGTTVDEKLASWLVNWAKRLNWNCNEKRTVSQEHRVLDSFALSCSLCRWSGIEIHGHQCCEWRHMSGLSSSLRDQCHPIGAFTVGRWTLTKDYRLRTANPVGTRLSWVVIDLYLGVWKLGFSETHIRTFSYDTT